MADAIALTDIERRIELVQAQLRQLAEQAAAYPAPPTKSAMPTASPSNRRSSTRCEGARGAVSKR